MSSKTDHYSELPEDRPSWLRRCLRFFAIVFLIIFICCVFGHTCSSYQREKLKQLLHELDQQGIKVEIRTADPRASEHRWLHQYQKYLPAFITELLEPSETSVKFNGYEVTPESLSVLAKLSNVTSVYLDGCYYIDDEALHQFSNLKSLTYLSIYKSPISGHGFIALQNLPKLRGIYLYPNYWLDDNAIDQILRIKQLKYVQLEGVKSVVPGKIDITGPNNSKAIKVGEIVTFRGAFTSTHFVPKEVTADCYLYEGNHELKTAGRAKGFATEGGNGRYHFNFVTQGLGVGHYTARIEFTVTKQVSENPNPIDITFTLDTANFEVKKE